LIASFALPKQVKKLCTVAQQLLSRAKPSFSPVASVLKRSRCGPVNATESNALVPVSTSSTVPFFTINCAPVQESTAGTFTLDS
jgi:hypothetical protein